MAAGLKCTGFATPIEGASCHSFRDTDICTKEQGYSSECRKTLKQKALDSLYALENEKYCVSMSLRSTKATAGPYIHGVKQIAVGIEQIVTHKPEV